MIDFNEDWSDEYPDPLHIPGTHAHIEALSAAVNNDKSRYYLFQDGEQFMFQDGTFYEFN